MTTDRHARTKSTLFGLFRELKLIDRESFCFYQLDPETKRRTGTIDAGEVAARIMECARVIEDTGEVELINRIRDMHSAPHDAPCSECGQAHPCRTYAYVDGLLAARFEE